MTDRSESQETYDNLHKAWTHIGEFLWLFGVLENRINGLIGKLFKLDVYTSLTLTANIDLRRKLIIANIGVEQQKSISRAAKEKANTLFNALHELHDDRNVIAHSAYWVSDTGELNFDYVRLRNRLKLPDKVWNEAKFQSSRIKIGAAIGELDKLTGEIMPLTEADIGPNLLGGIGSLSEILLGDWEPDIESGQTVLDRIEHSGPEDQDKTEGSSS